jgi:EAL domain-containing protein (putative c-di-GMP-specific phosphodiesterase class I)/GGDEF domain-containing protein
MSDHIMAEDERLVIQSKLAELQQETEVSHNRLAELEQENHRLSAENEKLLSEQQTLRNREAELERLLNRNPATGLPIRRLFDRDFERLLAEVHAQDRGPRIAVGLLRLGSDYERIKNTRDRNRVLLYKTTDRIKEIVGDNVYQSDRLDEFLLIFRNMPNIDGVELRADQVVDEVSRPHEPPADDVMFGCSLGTAVFPYHGETREELLGNADIALIESERTRTPHVVYTDDMGDRFRERQSLEVELKAAIQGGFEQFSLHYQPFVDRDGKITGAEALIRWNHPTAGFISPARFIPIAEETGSIRFIGQWTLYRACRQLKSWHREGHEDLSISINLSPSQFKQLDLVERIDGILDSVRLKGSSLKLELTETTIMDDPEDAIVTMNQLRDQGITMSLDDFGTGYSSLSYLRRFPIDTLKIDRSFITDVDTNPANQEIVKAMIAMGTSFGMETLAEGVERKEELEFLFDLGCDHIQGYYFSKPVPDVEFQKLLADGISFLPSGK